MFITHCDSRAISKSTIPECCGSKPGLCSEIWDYKVFHISIQQLQNLWWNSDPLMYPFFVADAVSAPSSEHEPLWLSFHHFSFPVSLPHPLWPLFKQKKKSVTNIWHSRNVAQRFQTHLLVFLLPLSFPIGPFLHQLLLPLRHYSTQRHRFHAALATGPAPTRNGWGKLFSRTPVRWPTRHGRWSNPAAILDQRAEYKKLKWFG